MGTVRGCGVKSVEMDGAALLRWRAGMTVIVAGRRGLIVVTVKRE